MAMKKFFNETTVNSLGEKVLPCLTPFFIRVFSLTLCSFIVAVLSLMMSSNIFAYISTTPCLLSAFITTEVSTESKAFHS